MATGVRCLTPTEDSLLPRQPSVAPVGSPAQVSVPANTSTSTEKTPAGSGREQLPVRPLVPVRIGPLKYGYQDGGEAKWRLPPRPAKVTANAGAPFRFRSNELTPILFINVRE